MAQLRTVVVGYGVSGRVFHAPLIANSPDYDLVGVVTSNAERAEQARSVYPGITVLDSFETLLERIDSEHDIDLVVLGTPPVVHEEQAIALLSREVSVVVDKPAAPTAAALRRMIEASESSSGHLTVFQNRRWDADFVTLRKQLNAGALGKVQTFESRFEWFSSRNAGTSWKDTTPIAKGGGILLDVGPHLIDQAVQAFGPVDDVYAEMSQSSPDAVNDEITFVSLRHASGVRSRLSMSRHSRGRGPRFLVSGTDAAFRSEGYDPQESQLGAGLSPAAADYGALEESQIEMTDGSATWTPELERGDYPRFYSILYEALTQGGPLPVDSKDVLEVLTLIERIHGEFAVNPA